MRWICGRKRRRDARARGTRNASRDARAARRAAACAASGWPTGALSVASRASAIKVSLRLLRLLANLHVKFIYLLELNVLD